MSKPNREMVRQGYAPISMVAGATGKSKSAIHRMIEEGELSSVRDGSIHYIAIKHLEQMFKGHPLSKAVDKLKKQMGDVLKEEAAE
jgi:hypothetical protein